MTAQLIDAAVEAGIPPISIRHRLKDEHMLTVGNETITRGTDVIYRVPSVVVAEKAQRLLENVLFVGKMVYCTVSQHTARIICAKGTHRAYPFPIQTPR